MKRKPIIPLAGVLRNYRRADLSGDLTAGFTTAVMLIPQAMAYAMLAGLPPIVGLYASLVPLALYAAFGSSPQLAVGPVAMVSLLVATGVGAIAPTGSPEFIGLAVLLAGMVGVMQLAMGLLRAGFLVNFLSHPVLSGFTSAAALIIGFSQLKHLLGVSIPRSHHVHEIISGALAKIGVVSVPTLLLGVAAIAGLMLMKKYRPMYPRALVVVVLGALAVWAFGLTGEGVAIVGAVPGGLPHPSIPMMSMDAMRELLPIAITIALVGFMESISVAKNFARRHRYEVDADQELVGLGVANIGGAMFGAYPVTGGFSRTAVNAQAGAKTTVASLITAAVVGLTLLFFTPLFYYLPKAVLAAIIMTAVFGLVDVAEVRHLWKVKKSDLALLVITFVATLGLGIELGIGVGVAASMLWFVVRKTRPHTAVLGRLPGTDVYRNVDRHPEAQTYSGALIIRMDATFYFGNVEFLKTTLRRCESDTGDCMHTVIVDASAMNELDASADAALHEIAEDFTRRGVRLAMAGVKGPVMDVMRRSGFDEVLGADRFFHTVHEAVVALDVEQVSEHHAAARRRREAQADFADANSGIVHDEADALGLVPAHAVPSR